MKARRGYAGKTAVVTGAGSGIGRALALNLAERGARLALSDVQGDAVQETVRQCQEQGAQARAWKLDVSDREAVLAHAEEVVEHFGGVDLVVNNAGVSVTGRVAELTDADHRWIMGINYFGMVHGTQAFLPHLAASGDGQLANVSSVFGLMAFPKQAAYNGSKFAIRGFTEALRMELLADQVPVQVSLVHPGGVRSNIAENARVTASENKMESAKAFNKIAMTTPQGAARSIMRGLEREKPRILVGPDSRVIAALPRLLGARYQGLVHRLG
ncbi:SDR family NAD(P)-dependent oxidoreductase [Rhodococcus sp. X156]|uniref:SDR family NAD(P)-dependent oxidoreductase n=1 Tax=Rhodococcus sp. X156 TaxID=2499145 RepID=UPI000FDA2B08|nr:SDR family NAD(P)-dependent oxidoreductase [Rhodococcus sp. X156]